MHTKTKFTLVTHYIKRSGILSILISISLLVSPTAYSQEQWSLSFPEETRTGHFFTKSPDNSNLFYFFGHDVQVMNATDQSLTSRADLPKDVLHKESTTGYTTPYRHMDIFTWDKERWWMVHEGRILKTTNAGNSWQEVVSLTPNTQYLSSPYFTSICFPSEHVGYAVGTADKIFRTLDGGDNWTELQWSNSTAPYRRLSDVYFVNESVGFALGYEVDDIQLNIGVYKPLYYYTTNAGQTWNETSFPESDHHYVDLQVVAGDTWYLSLTNRNFIAPNDKLFKSTNGGNHWEEITLPSSSSVSMVMRDMHWFTPDEGLVLGSTETFGSPNHVYKTYNGGESWKEITLDQGSLPFFVKIPNITIKFNGDHGVLAGGTGHLLYSEDKGETWQTVQKGYPDVHDLSSSAGVTYAALYGNAVIKNDESGWSELTAPLNSQHQKAAFDKVSNLGADDLALKDVYGEIHYSQDGGSTWNSLFTSLEDRALDIQFIDEKLAALVFKDNALLYYPDAKDLQSMELIIDGTPLPASVFDLFEVGDVLFARVESFLFKRENGSWEQVFFNNYVIRSLMMDEKGNAIMRFQDNTYHYSNDTGETWQETAFSDDILNRIDFTISTINGYGWLNDTTHYALVHGSPDISERFETSLILSADKGKSWESADFAIFSEPNELGRIGHSVDDEGNLWVGSANGSIYQWTLKETITGNEDPVSSVFSVYPNPTTGQFKLFTTQEIESYQLMNLHGQIIERGAFIRNSEYRIPEEKPTGLYILQLLTSTGEKRVVKIAKR